MIFLAHDPHDDLLLPCEATVTVDEPATDLEPIDIGGEGPVDDVPVLDDGKPTPFDIHHEPILILR